jgi:ubiquinone/menaquinone biosynthesis C-methylase UbiE
VSDVRGAWGKYAPAFAAEGKGAEDRDSLRKLVELCALPSGSLLLDVASGAGYTGFAFAGAGCRVILSDPTHEMLLAGRAGWTERALDGVVRSVETWAESLPFTDESLDAVVAHRAPHQFADIDAFAAEAKRVLRPGGVVGLADQSPPDGFETWHNDLERMRDPTHERALSPREFRAVVERAGFSIRSTDVVFQSHDVEDWLDRVDCPSGRRATAHQMLENIPDEIRDIYRPELVEGRLVMRTPQHVLAAIR